MNQQTTGGLRPSMRPRHLIMMSLGSAIGAGLFVGSGEGIAAAGPAVLVSYAIAGLIVIAVMRMLGEMVAADPNPGAFSYYVGKALGPSSAFAVGWLWWITLCLVVAAEATAAGGAAQDTALSSGGCTGRRTGRIRASNWAPRPRWMKRTVAWVRSCCVREFSREVLRSAVEVREPWTSWESSWVSPSGR